MALNDFRSAVVAGRARKPVAKPEPVRVPVMHMKSRECDDAREINWTGGTALVFFGLLFWWLVVYAF